MAIKKIDHIAINCYDLEKSIDFYCNILGLTIEKEVDMGECVLTYIRLPNGGALELFDYKERSFYEKLSKSENALKHLAFEVDEIEKMNEDLRQKKITFNMELCQLQQLGVKALLCLDPNGVVIELSEKIA